MYRSPIKEGVKYQFDWLYTLHNSCMIIFELKIIYVILFKCNKKLIIGTQKQVFYP